jgi:cytoskeleton protein RodZ
MNEPDELRPPVPPDDSGRSAPGFGYTLAQSRMRAGLSLEQAAARIRLHPRQLRALEDEDLTALPAAAYAAGFVRNYARELKIDPGPLVEDLNAKLRISGLGTPAPDLGTGGTVPVRLLDDRGWRQLVLAVIVIALVCAGLIGVWMAHSGGGLGPTATRTPASADSAPLRAAEPATAGKPASQTAGGTGSQKDGSPEATPETGAPATGSAAPLAPGATAPAASSGSGELLAPESAASAGATADSRVPVAEVTPVPGATTGLVLHFTDRSWVEVSRADGRVLLSHSGEAGTVELLDAALPLLLTVGRAEAVQVEYRGRPVNLKPYVNTKGVARLTIADSRATSGGPSSR